MFTEGCAHGGHIPREAFRAVVGGRERLSRFDRAGDSEHDLQVIDVPRQNRVTRAQRPLERLADHMPPVVKNIRRRHIDTADRKVGVRQYLAARQCARGKHAVARRSNGNSDVGLPLGIRAVRPHGVFRAKREAECGFAGAMGNFQPRIDRRDFNQIRRGSQLAGCPDLDFGEQFLLRGGGRRRRYAGRNQHHRQKYGIPKEQ